MSSALWSALSIDLDRQRVDHARSVQGVLCACTLPIRSHASSAARGDESWAEGLAARRADQAEPRRAAGLNRVGRRERGRMPIEPREVWRSLPETLRQAIAEDIGQVLREMSDGLGTRKTGSPGPQSGGVCPAVDATPSDRQSRKPKASVRPLAARSRSRMARGGYRCD